MVVLFLCPASWHPKEISLHCLHVICAAIEAVGAAALFRKTDLFLSFLMISVGDNLLPNLLSSGRFISSHFDPTEVGTRFHLSLSKCTPEEQLVLCRVFSFRYRFLRVERLPFSLLFTCFLGFTRWVFRPHLMPAWVVTFFRWLWQLYWAPSLNLLFKWTYMHIVCSVVYPSVGLLLAFPLFLNTSCVP